MQKNCDKNFELGRKFSKLNDQKNIEKLEEKTGLNGEEFFKNLMTLAYNLVQR